MIPHNRSLPSASRRSRRLANRLCHRARHWLRLEHDRLPGSLRADLMSAERELRSLCRARASASQVGQGIAQLETLIAQAFPNRLHAPLRPAWDMFFVAVIIALTARTFFVQPFSVPTGSMEPTLRGITSTNLRNDPDFVMPGWSSRLWQRVIRGTRYFDLIARSDGMLEDVRAPRWLHPFAQYRFRIGPASYRVPATLEPFLDRHGPQPHHFYHAGEPILRFRVTHGDFLLADRLSYNFRRPKRGEIVIFESDPIDVPEPNYYYVKRLVALDGDRVRIGNDRHLVINDRRLDADTPGFESVYTSHQPLISNAYVGHLNASAAARTGLRNPQDLAPLFPNEQSVYRVRTSHFLVMGDNSLLSLDSRAWGDLPYRHILGRARLIYWPFSSRTGRIGP